MSSQPKLKNKFTWKKIGLLLCLILGIFMIPSAFSPYKRHQAITQLRQSGGNIRYQPIYIRLPRIISATDYRLPEVFSSKIEYLEIASWEGPPESLNRLGRLAPRAEIKLSNPASLPDEFFHQWDGLKLSARLTITGNDDLVDCFIHLAESPFQALTLRRSHVTDKEAAALVKCRNLKTLILWDVTLDLAAIEYLKKADLPYVAYLNSNQSDKPGQLTQATQFLREYGSTDVLHWNHFPKRTFFHQHKYLSHNSNQKEKHLAFDITSRTMTHQDALEILNALDLNDNQLISVDLTTHPGDFESTLYHPRNWPASRRDEIKSIRFEKMPTGQSWLDLNQLTHFKYLERLDFSHRMEIRNWEALAILRNLKSVRFEKQVLIDFAQHLTACQQLEELDTPLGIISQSDLKLLMQKPTMNRIVCTPEHEHANTPLKSEITQLCKTYGWSIKQIKDRVRFSLERTEQDLAP